jgi:hypothetical protein
LIGPNLTSPLSLSVLSAPVTIEPDGPATATPTVARSAPSARKATLRRGLPTMSRRM